MADAVRISDDQFRRIYEAGFTLWAQLHHNSKNSNLPVYCLRLQDAFCMQPFFPRNLNLKQDETRVLATGYSFWELTGADCKYGLPSFRQQVKIGVTAGAPISLLITGTQNDSGCASWFIRDDNYLAILILAWAYILSARWTEVMPGPCTLTYTESQATYHDATNHQNNRNCIDVDIGGVSPEEARWWAAILARGQGWQATMTFEHNTSLSPWSIHLQRSPQFVLSRTLGESLLRCSIPSFADSYSYLTKFCIYHNIIDQSHTALAAVLLLPSMGASRILQLPIPRISTRKRSEDLFTCPGGSLQHNWVHQDHLDKLLTLSCNIRGIRPMLLSVFYEPSIECNAVSAWLQGALAAIGSLTKNNLCPASRSSLRRADYPASTKRKREGTWGSLPRHAY
ncbi:uncharacterized protein BDR25DRAFT_383147 [Lindgomyces ingoldianus]|uniref:Uncharacterized protein n=1 Tax=Lindgomyces ingoldianus TaxID=673940 RepID=A0ACB6QCG6_9PLEO|nr:uncharacterized protein BDR25DRAFT_383147 [Lindgomyces ingoldianus]KAF2463835.1 hypothetical protein BDR25DRAFT_383147 [Lindgomyces ingoldianus]